MPVRTTKYAAKALGVTSTTLRKYIKDPAFPKPKSSWRGKQKQFEWDDELIEKYRKIIEEARHEV